MLTSFLLLLRTQVLQLQLDTAARLEQNLVDKLDKAREENDELKFQVSWVTVQLSNVLILCFMLRFSWKIEILNWKEPEHMLECWKTRKSRPVGNLRILFPLWIQLPNGLRSVHRAWRPWVPFLSISNWTTAVAQNPHRTKRKIREKAWKHPDDDLARFLWVRVTRHPNRQAAASTLRHLVHLVVAVESPPGGHNRRNRGVTTKAKEIHFPEASLRHHWANRGMGP